MILNQISDEEFKKMVISQQQMKPVLKPLMYSGFFTGEVITLTDTDDPSPKYIKYPSGAESFEYKIKIVDNIPEVAGCFITDRIFLSPKKGGTEEEHKAKVISTLQLAMKKVAAISGDNSLLTNPDLEKTRSLLGNGDALKHRFKSRFFISVDEKEGRLQVSKVYAPDHTYKPQLGKRIGR